MVFRSIGSGFGGRTFTYPALNRLLVFVRSKLENAKTSISVAL